MKVKNNNHPDSKKNILETSPIKNLINKAHSARSNQRNQLHETEIKTPREIIKEIDNIQGKEKTKNSSNSKQPMIKLNKNSPKEGLNRENSNVNLKLKLENSRILHSPMVKAESRRNLFINTTLDDLKMTKFSHYSSQQDVLFLKLKKEAIQRPYNHEEDFLIGYKEVSIVQRNMY